MLAQSTFNRSPGLPRSILSSKTGPQCAALVALMTLALPSSARTQMQGENTCTLSEANVAWIQSALDGWQRVSVDVLELDPRPLPWMVLFNQTCTWHLAPDRSRLPAAEAAGVELTFAGQNVPVSVKRHDDDALWLPSGSTRSVEAAAFASAYESESGEQAPFFVLALPDVWLEGVDVDPASNPRAELLGVAIHELVHTLHVTQVARRIEELRDRYTVPESLNDDIIEDQFKDVPGFQDAHEAETDLLYRAVSEPDVVRKRTMANEALKMVRSRQATYFTGPDTVHRQLEEVFLNMEGVAKWARYELS